MSENKFIKHLKGKQTAKSLVEIDNQSAKTSFGKMPSGTSDSIVQYSDHRGNVTVVANGTTNWKIDGSDLVLATNVYGDGQDFLSTASVSGTGLWINSSYTFPSTGDPRHPIAMVFNPSTKWVLKVCGDNLIVDGGSTIDFTMLVKIGTANVYSKNFTVRESAGQFSKEFVIDFGEANLDIVKAGGLSTLTVQLLCGTANASARIYNGMSVLTCLQRKVDASAVSNNGGNVEDVLNGNMIPTDYFSNPAFIDQIEDGDEAYAVFTRDGDTVALSGWADIIQVSTMPAGNADNVGRIVQWIGDTVRTKHDYITFTATEMSTNITAYVSYTSRLLTKIAAINTELGITVDKIKVLVSSLIDYTYPVYDVYVYEGNTEYLYEQGANLTSSYGLDIQHVSGQWVVGDYAIFEAEFDDEYLYNGCFYKCNSSIERGYKSTVFSVSITDLSLLESKVAEANTTFNINTAKLKFQLADANRNFNVYAVESDDTEHLFADTVTASYIQTTFGVGIVQTGSWNAGEYFEYDVVYSWDIVLGDLSNLVDIELNSVSDGQSLVYDADSGKWVNETVDALPSQTGQSGKFLTTNGTTAYWDNVSQMTATYDAVAEKITFA